MSAMLSVDAVVCTRDRPVELAACLASLARQTERPTRVLVVDAGREPAWVHAVQELTVEVFRCDPGLPRQRNLALEHVHADLVAFFDDDVELEPEYLAVVRAWFASHNACVGASGNITNDGTRSVAECAFRRAFAMAPDDGSLQPSGDTAYLRRPARPTRVDVLSGANMVYRRVALDGIRFRQELGQYAYMEDADVALQVGRRGELWVLDQAHLVHHLTASSRLPRARYVEEVLVNSTLLFGAHRPHRQLSAWAFARRMAGRCIAYALMAVRQRSLSLLVGIVRGLGRSTWLARRPR